MDGITPSGSRKLPPMTTPPAEFITSRRQPTIREMPTGERPRERLVEYGSKHLSNTELIAILLRTGSAGENVISLSSRLLTRFGGLAGLGKAAFAELCGEKGLSDAKASQPNAAGEHCQTAQITAAWDPHGKSLNRRGISKWGTGGQATRGTQENQYVSKV